MNKLVARIALLTIAGMFAGCPAEKKPVVAAPPPDVEVATVLQRDVPVYVEAIGELRGNTEIEIRANLVREPETSGP